MIDKPTPIAENVDMGKVLALVDAINAKQKELYPGYDPVRYCERPFGVNLRLVIFTLAKTFYSNGFVGTTLAGYTVTEELMQSLVEVFDIANVHGLANYLVDHFEEVEDFDRYILTSLINAHRKALKQSMGGAA